MQAATVITYTLMRWFCLPDKVIGHPTSNRNLSLYEMSDYEVFSVYEDARGMEDDDIIQKAVEEKLNIIYNLSKLKIMLPEA